MCRDPFGDSGEYSMAHVCDGMSQGWGQRHLSGGKEAVPSLFPPAQAGNLTIHVALGRALRRTLPQRNN